MKAITEESKMYWRYLYYVMRWCGDCPSEAKKTVITWDCLHTKHCPMKAGGIIKIINFDKQEGERV